MGDRSFIEPVGMPESTQEVLRELLAQNRMILETNCAVMRMIGSPMVIVSKETCAENGGGDGLQN